MVVIDTVKGNYDFTKAGGVAEAEDDSLAAARALDSAAVAVQTAAPGFEDAGTSLVV